jgi:beta-phosphoglucomutase
MRNRWEKVSGRRGAGAAGRPDAVVFDFDGVLFDTERLHHRALADTLRPLGLAMTWREYLRTYVGYDDRGVFREAFRAAGRRLPAAALERLVAAKGRAFRRAAAGGAARPCPGAARLLRAAARGAPVALCTGALPSDVEPLLRRARLLGCFEVRVTAADPVPGKPDPAGYRLALARLASRPGARAIAPGRSLAIEDTPAGVAAARAAGLRVLAVASTTPARQLRRADRVVSSLDTVTFPALCRLVTCGS